MISTGKTGTTKMVITYDEPPTTLMNAGITLTAVRKIVLPDSITAVTQFQEARNIEEINLENITTVGEGAFYGLAADTDPITVRLPNVRRIEMEAFIEANADIYIPADVTEVEEDAFLDAKTLHYSGNLPGAPWGATEWIRD